MKPTKVCQREECRAIYERPNSSGREEWANRVYCSRACYEAEKRAEALAALPLCEYCRERQVKHQGRKFCGLSCAGKAQAAAGRTPAPPPQQAKPKPECARPGCAERVPLRSRKFCGRACSGLARQSSPERKVKAAARERTRLASRERDRARSQARRDAAKPRKPKPYEPPPGYFRPLWRPPGALDHPMPIGPSVEPGAWRVAG